MPDDPLDRWTLAGLAFVVGAIATMVILYYAMLPALPAVALGAGLAGCTYIALIFSAR